MPEQPTFYGDGDWLPPGTIFAGRITGKWSIATAIFEEKMSASKIEIVSERSHTQATALPLPTGHIREIYWGEALEGMTALDAKGRAGIAAFHAGSNPVLSELIHVPVHMTPGYDSGFLNQFGQAPVRIAQAAESAAGRVADLIETGAETAKEVAHIPLYLAIAGSVAIVGYLIWRYLG